MKGFCTFGVTDRCWYYRYVGSKGKAQFVRARVFSTSVVLLVYSIRDHRDLRLTIIVHYVLVLVRDQVPPSRAHHPCRHALIIAAIIGTIAT